MGGDMEKHDERQVMGWEKEPGSNILTGQQLATSLPDKARKQNSPDIHAYAVHWECLGLSQRHCCNSHKGWIRKAVS